MIAHSSSETIWAQGSNRAFFKGQKKLSTKNAMSSKTSFKNEGEMKLFHNEEKLKEIVASRFSLVNEWPNSFSWVLTARIRQKIYIKGIKIEKAEMKMFLLVDDIMIYIKNTKEFFFLIL